MLHSLSETLTATVPVGFPEYLDPPEAPLPLLRTWLDDAVRLGVREPKALALATADNQARPSNRIVALTDLTPSGVVFTTHDSSQKGRELASNPWASGVLYWRETSQQVVLCGPVEMLSVERADEYWRERPISTHAMSVSSHQSDLLDDVEELRSRAVALGGHGQRLTRPDRYRAYELVPTIVEFWANGSDRLHERLQYSASSDSWIVRRLQP